MKKNRWNIGAILWFVLMIACQWLMFIEYATKPITKEKVEYQRLTVLYLIVGLIGTALYLWLIFSKKKGVLLTILTLSVINTITMLFKGDFSTALISLIQPTITFLIARKTVGYGKNQNENLDSETKTDSDSETKTEQEGE